MSWKSDETCPHPDSGCLVPPEQWGMRPNTESGTLACGTSVHVDRQDETAPAGYGRVCEAKTITTALERAS